MNYQLILLSILAGIFIAIQSALSGQISSILKNPMASTFIVYCSGALFVFLYLSKEGEVFALKEKAKDVPLYLWIVGGLLSSIGLTLVYKAMPVIGVSRSIAAVIFGQSTTSVMASHFAWFGLPQKEFSLWSFIGLVLMGVGVLFINKEI